MRKRTKPTKNMLDVLAKVWTFKESRGWWPCARNLADYQGRRAKAAPGIQNTLSALESMGLVVVSSRSESGHRFYEITKEGKEVVCRQVAR